MIQIAVIFTLVVVTTAKPGYINSVPTFHNAITLQAAPIALAQPIVQTVPQDVSYTRTDIISRKVTGSAPTAAYVDHHGVAGYVENSVPHSVKHVHYIEENISRNQQPTQQNEAEPVIEDKLRQIQIPQPQRIVAEGTSSSDVQTQQASSNSLQRQTQAQSQPQQPPPQYLPSVSRISQEQQQQHQINIQQQQQQQQAPQQQQQQQNQQAYIEQLQQQWQQQQQQEQLQQQQQQQQEQLQQQAQLQQQQAQQEQAQLQQHAQLLQQQQAQFSSAPRSSSSAASTATTQQSQQLNFGQPQIDILQDNLRSVPYLPNHPVLYKSQALQIYNNPKPVEHPAPKLQQEEDTESISTVAAEAPLATESIDNNQHQPQQHITVSHSVIPTAKLSYSVINAPHIAYAQHSAIPATYSSSAIVDNVYPAVASPITYPTAGIEKTYYPATAARIEALAAPSVYHAPTVYNAPLKLAAVHHAPALAYNVATKIVENPAAVHYSNVY